MWQLRRGGNAKGGKGDYHRIDGCSKSEFPSFSPRKCVFARGARGLVTETWFEPVERGQRRGLKIEKVGMEGGRTERSRRQLLRERESLFFCLEDQTSFCNRKFSTAAPAKPDPAETINVSWIKWNTGEYYAVTQPLLETRILRKKHYFSFIYDEWFPFSRISSCKHFPIIVGTSRILDSKVFFWSSTYRFVIRTESRLNYYIYCKHFWINIDYINYSRSVLISILNSIGKFSFDLSNFYIEFFATTFQLILVI